MAINQSQYVDITSTVAGVSATGAPSLQHRRFSSSKDLVFGQVLTIQYSQIDDIDSLLASEADRNFALQYFAVRTTAPASKPKSIQFVGTHSENGLTILDAYKQSKAIDSNFGSLSFDNLATIEDAELLNSLATYHASLNLEHQLFADVGAVLADVETSEVYKALKNTPMTAFILNTVPGEYKETIPAGLMDATDYEGVNTVNSIMYRQAPNMTPDITNTTDKILADSLLLNYYGQTAVNATNLSFFQKGVLNGGLADPRAIEVAMVEQWIKGKVASDLINLLVASRLPASIDGITRIKTIIINGAVASALRSGGILPLKTLTPLQIEVITDITGDPLAHNDIFQNGYWLDVEMRTEVVNGIEEKHAYYTLVYSKADFVRKIVGSHNLI